jgi:hypothetical protein
MILLPSRGMNSLRILALSMAALASASSAPGQEIQITVQADRVTQFVPRLHTGACIEDVNHEIYGGIYSQMIFGESFQEPPPAIPPKGFKAFGGRWKVTGDELAGDAGDGPKLISERPAFSDGEVGVEVLFPDRRMGNAGLILRAGNAGPGADNFDGYEVSLDAAAQILRLGRHRHNWELIQNTPCEVRVGQWIQLEARLAGNTIEVLVDGRSVVRHTDGARALAAGAVGLRQWQREARYRSLWIKSGASREALPFTRPEQSGAEVSGMWRAVSRGGAAGAWAIDRTRTFAGAQSQRLAFTGGEGEVGVENQGLNRWGLHLAGGKPYEGLLWARADKPQEVWVALESADGSRIQAEKRLKLPAGDWQRLEFSLTPKATETKGRFAIKLKRPGSVTLGYAFLQPAAWGRFKGLPVRRDVADGLLDQGVTVLRYGGSMINHPEYRWKKMIGPRDRRPPHRNTWYPHASNGWGILDFMDFCEAASLTYIPAFSVDESPQDMEDFIEYATGSTRTPWGRQRAAAGRAKPYALRYLELGNEERVDETYYRKFKALAEAIWAKAPDLTLVVGDFVYSRPIADPYQFTGAASGITSLAAQKKILDLARQHGREVWSDLHVGTDGPRPDETFTAMFTYLNALERIAEGARFKVAVFEFNAGNHTQRRALANALAYHAIERDGRIPIVASANCLQPDGQNDNGWDQGLLFLNPARVWLQPPGYVTQMLSRNYLPNLVECRVSGPADRLDANAKRSPDGQTLVLQLVNPGNEAVSAGIQLAGFTPRRAAAQVTELTGALDARNTAAQPSNCVPASVAWRHGIQDGRTQRTVPPRSFTVIRFE